MCGICGIVSADHTNPNLATALMPMRDSLDHRGPDDAGYYVAPGIALGSRRLSILDLSDRGHMPMSTADGRYWIIYNGEVYNYQELRARLQTRGHRFRSNTDTEVLLTMYAADGPVMLEKLNGMFAFAIWDTQEHELFLARDRLGIKPLYYAYHEKQFYFASEQKALFAAGVPVQFDHNCWEELLCFRYIAGDKTPFIGIQRLLPGHFITWRHGVVRLKRWWNLGERARALREELPAEPVSRFRDCFDDAVKIRRISDVPVGVLLSGGLDSSSVAASLAKHVGSGVASFTVRFDESGYDEGPLAQQVAARYQLECHELFVAPGDLAEKLRQASYFNDEPLVHGNDLHLLAISQYAKSKVTVLLSGEGADETLGGYVRYQPLRHPKFLSLARRVMPRLKRGLYLTHRMNKLIRFLELDSVDRFVLFNACETLPVDLYRLGLPLNGDFYYRERVLDEARALYPEDAARQAMYSDQHTFLCSVLDRNDRMTMGASVECRVPFLDYRLVEMLAALPSSALFNGRRAKGILRRAVGFRLPRAVLQHRKWGFGVPWKQYMRQEKRLQALLHDMPNASLIIDSPLESSTIRKDLEDFFNGDDRSFPILMQLLMSALAWEAARTGISTDYRIGNARVSANTESGSAINT